MRLEMLTLRDLGVIDNMKKQWKHKSLNKKTTIQVQLVFYGPLVAIIS